MIYQFADCQLDARAHVLTRDGQEVHTEPQVFDLLVLLARMAPALVTQDDMIAEVWKGRIVSDSTLAARINAARKAVGDSGAAQAIIRTIPRRGVQMAVPVDAVADAPLDPQPTRKINQVIRYTTSRDGTRLAFAQSGEGPPLMRGSHWLSHLEHDWKSPVWRPLLDQLSAHHRLVRYDPRGTGLSDRTLRGGTLEDFVADLTAVADAASLDRFSIFAASQSAPVALGFAAAYPDRVSRMVLIGGFIRGSQHRADASVGDAMTEMIRSGWGKVGSPLMQAFSTVYMPTATPEELASFVEMKQISATPDTAAHLRSLIAEFDVSDILDKVTAPVLLLHADRDAVHPVTESQELAAQLPNAEFHMVDSPNHVMVPSDPNWREALQAAQAFLSAAD